MSKIELKNIDSWFPAKDRNEWVLLVRGEITHRFTNYVLQLKSYQIMTAVKNDTMTEPQGVKELQELSRKYAIAVFSDLKIIFNL